MQAYSDPRRESDPHALPDVEVWEETETMDLGFECGPGFYWQSCSPGCLPDGEPIGPFDTEAEALADCRASSGLCEHGIPQEERCEECKPSPLWVVQNEHGSYLYESMRASLRSECSCAAWSTREHAERAAKRYPGMTARQLTDDEAREWSYGPADAQDTE
jgi:hypothetical protein